MAAAMKAVNKPAMSNAQIPYFVVLDFVAGIFLVWLYAAIRPRFGAGPATPAKAGLAAWFLGGLLVTLFMWPVGLIPHNLIITPKVVGLVSWTLAAGVRAPFF